MNQFKTTKISKHNFLNAIRSGLSANFMAVNGRKLFYDSIKFREIRYRARMSEIPMPIDLFNGTEWDSLSQSIWAKFEQRRQTRDTFEKKMQLWKNLREVVEVCAMHRIQNSAAKRKRKIDRIVSWFPFLAILSSIGVTSWAKGLVYGWFNYFRVCIGFI